MPQRISASVGFGVFLSRASDDISMPGVQNPHCRPCSCLDPSCKGWRWPSFIKPSTVVISAPLAWTPNMVHDFTVLPLKITVHAPQLLVSQPMCVPVSPADSRMKWTSSVRGSISASVARPLMVILTCCLPAMRGVLPQSVWPLLTGPFHGPGQSPFGELFNQALLVFRRTAE